MTFEDLRSGLGSLFEITGILYVGTDNAAPWLRNLTFLSKLRRIGGGRFMLRRINSLTRTPLVINYLPVYLLDFNLTPKCFR